MPTRDTPMPTGLSAIRQDPTTHAARINRPPARGKTRTTFVRQNGEERRNLRRGRGDIDNAHAASVRHLTSRYKPIGTDGPRPRSTSASLVDGPMRGRDHAPEAPCGVGTSRSAMLCAIFSDPDELMSRTLAPTRTAGASRCQVGTRRERRLAITPGRWRTPWRTRDCAAAPRSAPTCFVMRPEPEVPPGLAARPSPSACNVTHRSSVAWLSSPLRRSWSPSSPRRRGELFDTV